MYYKEEKSPLNHFKWPDNKTLECSDITLKKGFKKWIELRHDNDILKKCIKVVNQKLHLQIGTYLYKHTFSDTDRLGKKPKKNIQVFIFSIICREKWATAK